MHAADAPASLVTAAVLGPVKTTASVCVGGMMMAVGVSLANSIVISG
jgi:hypothetical protein